MFKIALFSILLSFLCRNHKSIPEFCSQTGKASCYIFKHIRNSFSVILFFSEAPFQIPVRTRTFLVRGAAVPLSWILCYLDTMSSSFLVYSLDLVKHIFLKLPDNRNMAPNNFLRTHVSEIPYFSLTLDGKLDRI